jgi:hypothetical protein
VKTVALAAAVVLSPNPAHFGDLVTAHVAGGPPPRFAPFAVRAQHGSDYLLQCLDPACVPGPGARTVKIGDARAVIVPRTTAAQVAHPLRSFRRQTQVPPPAYRIGPASLRIILFGVALALVALAAFLLAPLVRRLVPQPRDDRTPLQRALDLVRSSLGRDTEERRRALDVLARTLDRDPRARDALDLAWSAPAPEARRVEELLAEVQPE